MVITDHTGMSRNRLAKELQMKVGNAKQKTILKSGVETKFKQAGKGVITMYYGSNSQKNENTV